MNNKKIIAKCGLLCTDCNAYKATVSNNDELRKEAAETWSKMFGVNIDWKTVNCMGCHSKDILFSHCKVCEIRKCANEKNYSTCAECNDFGCEKIQTVWEHDSEAKQNLEQLL